MLFFAIAEMIKKCTFLTFQLNLPAGAWEARFKFRRSGTDSVRDESVRSGRDEFSDAFVPDGTMRGGNFPPLKHPTECMSERDEWVVS